MRQIKVITLICVLFGLADESRASGPPAPPPASGYSLAFFDDFTNLDLSSNVSVSGQYTWYKGIWWESVPSPFGASVASSVLTLKWNRDQNPPDTTITSCSRDGLHCRAFRYGYFEARMKWDVSTGAWPAFWMLPVENTRGAPETGELDVFEGQGDLENAHTFFGTIHDWARINGVPTDIANNSGRNYHQLSGVDFSQWHNYGVLWVPGRVTWYFDEHPILSAPTYPIFDEQSFYLILAAQEGANWQGGSTSGVAAKSLNLYVDWVKVWQK
jgi:Glycosyl hydrolases family 16